LHNALAWCKLHQSAQLAETRSIISADNALFRPLRSLQCSWLNEAPRQCSLKGKHPRRKQCRQICFASRPCCLLAREQTTGSARETNLWTGESTSWSRNYPTPLKKSPNVYILMQKINIKVCFTY